MANESTPSRRELECAAHYFAEHIDSIHTKLITKNRDPCGDLKYTYFCIAENAIYALLRTCEERHVPIAKQNTIDI